MMEKHFNEKIIKLEELGLMLLGIYLFNQLEYAWWWFLVLILVPDFSMIGYLFGNKVGAFSYNLAHHRVIALGVYFVGIYFLILFFSYWGLFCSRIRLWTECLAMG